MPFPTVYSQQRIIIIMRLPVSAECRMDKLIGRQEALRHLAELPEEE